jgi:hypothetical protein
MGIDIRSVRSELWSPDIDEAFSELFKSFELVRNWTEIVSLRLTDVAEALRSLQDSKCLSNASQKSLRAELISVVLETHELLQRRPLAVTKGLNKPLLPLLDDAQFACERILDLGFRRLTDAELCRLLKQVQAPSRKLHDLLHLVDFFQKFCNGDWPESKTDIPANVSAPKITVGTVTDDIAQLFVNQPDLKTAKAKTIQKLIGRGTKVTRDALRRLQDAGEYSGFARRRPSRFQK